MPKLAAFPKAFMQALCKDGTMHVVDWIDLASSLDIEGLEWYAGFLEMQEEKNWIKFRHLVELQGKTIPMLCCSPDFTHPDKAFRIEEIQKQKRWINMAAALGSSYCRVLSGQRRPDISVEDGLQYAVECIKACLSYAQDLGIILILENHYKDDFWEYPELAQKMDVFCQLAERIRHPNFGINYDPSNVYLAGENPIELLKRVAPRVVTMHASDRYLISGNMEDLKREEAGTLGYVKRLRHGEIGKGLNDFDAIFSELSRVGFDGWISIEDGIEGIEQMARSVTFLRGKIRKYWG